MWIVLIMLVVTTLMKPQTNGNIYSVWNSDGVHLMMCDNGTPTQYDDDWVVDWEDNREIVVTLLDK